MSTPASSIIKSLTASAVSTGGPSSWSGKRTSPSDEQPSVQPTGHTRGRFLLTVDRKARAKLQCNLWEDSDLEDPYFGPEKKEDLAAVSYWPGHNDLVSTWEGLELAAQGEGSFSKRQEAAYQCAISFLKERTKVIANTLWYYDDPGATWISVRLTDRGIWDAAWCDQWGIETIEPQIWIESEPFGKYVTISDDEWRGWDEDSDSGQEE